MRAWRTRSTAGWTSGVLCCLLFATCGTTALAQEAPKGQIRAQTQEDGCVLGNSFLEFHWNRRDRHVRDVTITDRLSHHTVELADAFALLLSDGTVEPASAFRVESPPQQRLLSGNARASRLAERLNGVEIDTALASPDGNVRALWSVILRDGSQYVQQRVTLTAMGHDVSIRRVQMLNATLPDAVVLGSVEGSPIVSGDLYLGFEDPLSTSKVTAGRATAYIDRTLPLVSHQSVTYSSVIGVTHPGQLRREFLAYIERERAHPYRTFLHYNSWYDLGRFNSYDEAGALDRIHAFGRELHDKRGVTLDSFLLDDGWDDHRSLWNFNEGFPQGLTAVTAEAAKYGTSPGLWMSPWGGYAEAKQERLHYGREQGYEIVNDGFALSGPRYYARFEDTCLNMIRKYGVNQFKFDGTGNAESVFKGSAFDSDFAAAIHLIGVLRQAKPDLFVNLTTGTYPSPFWLTHADSIWRGGEDDDVAGVGSYRERWITYRDAATYDNVVKNGPLFPLNSLMLHGLIYAERHKDLNRDPSNDFRNEVRSYFGTGTQTQEMYITPSLLSQANWDDLAEAARWSRTNAEVLKDTHWIGGDPAWLQVYGWASWSPHKAILVLRNPSDTPQSIRLDLLSALEVPSGAARSFRAHSPWTSDRGQPPFTLHLGQIHEFQLSPFEVLTLDLEPLGE